MTYKEFIKSKEYSEYKEPSFDELIAQKAAYRLEKDIEDKIKVFVTGSSHAVLRSKEMDDFREWYREAMFDSLIGQYINQEKYAILYPKEKES